MYITIILLTSYAACTNRYGQFNIQGRNWSGQHIKQTEF